MVGLVVASGLTPELSPEQRERYLLESINP